MTARITGIILILATIAAGIYVDIVWLLVDGITEIIHGAEAHPVSGGQIGWGIAHVVFMGAGVGVAALLCIAWAALFLGRPARRGARRPARPSYMR
jgi:uncharacterized membrane protein